MACVGEGLVVLSGADAESLDAARVLRRSVGGAECNVASGLVAQGVAAAWLSRVGDDPFGRFVVADLAGRGVDVAAVDVDLSRPTGLYLKDRDGSSSRMHYYRNGSAASAMDADWLASDAVTAALAAAEILHVSGITLGVVADPGAFVDALDAARQRHGLRLTVDLNWRPALWGQRDPVELVRLLSLADLAFLGADEAQTALGTGDVASLRTRLGERPVIVLKSDDHVAVSAAPDGRTASVSALTVDVLDPIGAGDAFAAGYLAGTLDGRPAQQCLRLGHLTAATVLVTDGDHAPAAPAAVRQALLTCPDEQWAATVVRAGAIESPALHPSQPVEERSR
ncbi:sugar kinase [Angustibacter luteus]